MFIIIIIIIIRILSSTVVTTHGPAHCLDPDNCNLHSIKVYHSHCGIFFSVSRQIGPVLYLLGTGALFMGLKQSECDTGYLTPEVGVEIRLRRAYC
jgi:hypothetical protein